jgi:hypothetical protein
LCDSAQAAFGRARPPWAASFTLLSCLALLAFLTDLFASHIDVWSCSLFFPLPSFSTLLPALRSRTKPASLPRSLLLFDLYVLASSNKPPGSALLHPHHASPSRTPATVIKIEELVFRPLLASRFPLRNRDPSPGLTRLVTWNTAATQHSPAFDLQFGAASPVSTTVCHCALGCMSPAHRPPPRLREENAKTAQIPLQSLIQ